MLAFKRWKRAVDNKKHVTKRYARENTPESIPINFICFSDILGDRLPVTQFHWRDKNGHPFFLT